jgi:hypothetical protein
LNNEHNTLPIFIIAGLLLLLARKGSKPGRRFRPCRFPLAAKKQATQYKISKIKLSISMIAVTPRRQALRLPSLRGDRETARSSWPGPISALP